MTIMKVFYTIKRMAPRTRKLLATAYLLALIAAPTWTVCLTLLFATNAMMQERLQMEKERIEAKRLR